MLLDGEALLRKAGWESNSTRGTWSRRIDPVVPGRELLLEARASSAGWALTLSVNGVVIGETEAHESLRAAVNGAMIWLYEELIRRDVHATGQTSP